ncbi:MAG: PBP1A family penicillin-binding protein [Pseudomonadota bacterium]
MAGAVAYFATGLPDISSVGAAERRPAITVLDGDGREAARYGDLTGDYVTVDQLPPHLINAVLAIEDRRFYGHPGVDVFGVARAAWSNLAGGGSLQGGSTITQQLAKNLFLSPERTWRRKVQEALLAVWLELNYSKDEILTAYLNRVYLGNGTYGVDAAARAYFGVPAADLNLRQAAMIAGLLRAPSRLAPTADLDAANRRADVVLAAMVNAGFVTRDQIVAQGADRPLDRAGRVTGSNGRYFSDWVVNQIPDFIGYEPTDLIVGATVNPAIQSIAHTVVNRHLAASDEGASQAAAVVLAPDGAVLAMVGGQSYGASQFNRATQALRQPGSAFKPIVYLAALETGLRPSTLVLDAPITRSGWSPRNFGEDYSGEITLQQALAESANTAAVRVLERAGVDRTIDLTRRLGITTPMRRDLSLALGTSEVSLLQLTGAYAAFANRGSPVIPYGIRDIVDRDGRLLYARSPDSLGLAADPQRIDMLNRMMAGVIEDGTGRNAAVGWRAAGKTGTSQDFRDAWFIGFTGDLVVGVWVGNDNGSPMDGVTGGGLPARIWRDIVAEVATVRAPAGLALVAPPVTAPLTRAPTTVEEQRALDDLIERMVGG